MSEEPRPLTREDILGALAAIAGTETLLVTIYDGLLTPLRSFLVYAGTAMPVPDDMRSAAYFTVSPITVSAEVQPGTDMAERIGSSQQDLCPSCGQKDDHNWIRSAGGLVACEKRGEAHREGE